MKKVFLLGSFALAALVSCKKDNNNETSSTDQGFMLKAAMSNTAEIQAGNLAASKGSSEAVRNFGQFMVTEHTQAQTDLKTLGTNNNYPIPDSVDAAHVALMARLNTLSGHDFDTAYINAQVMDHQTTLNDFNNELNNGQKQDVKNYASKYQPHIQMHLAMADSISKTL